MKSFALFFLVLFVGCYYCQSAQLTKLFTEYKNYRTANCLTGLTTSTTQQVQNIATNVCTTKSISGIPSGYSSMAYNFIDSSSTYDVFYNWVLSTFNNAKSTFASRCSAGDSSSNSTLARLVAAGPALQDIQCAFSSCAKNSNNQIPKYLVCIFKSPAITTCPNKCQTTGGSTPAPTTPASTTPAPTTPAPTTVTPQNIKDAFLKRQNEARTCLGLNTLVWNTTLANDAQAWANACAINCTSIHSFATTKPPRNERDQGENIWSFKGSGIDALMAIDLGNQLWIKEAIGWKCDGSNCSLTPTTPQLVTVQPATLPYSLSINLTTCGHYTQVIWRQSTSVGCAYAECPGSSPTKYLGVCRYNPPGNFVNMHPLYPNQDCTKASSCINSIQAQRSLTSSSSIAQTSSNTQTKSSTPFFANGSQVVVFALAIVIVVIVLSIFVVILITFFKNKKQDDYQLLEK